MVMVVWVFLAIMRRWDLLRVKPPTLWRIDKHSLQSAHIGVKKYSPKRRYPRSINAWQKAFEQFWIKK